MKKVLTYTALVLLFAACTADDFTGQQASNVPIAFTANMAADSTGTTRAANMINTNGELQSKSFGVFACYTGLHKYGDSNVTPDFMYNEKVTYDTDHWIYSPIKYWPNGEGETNSSINTGKFPHYISFMAYAPWSDNNSDAPSTNPAGYCIPSFSLQGEKGNPWLTYRLIEQEDLEHQVDLLCAEPLLDQTKPTTNDKLLFSFNHALACVGDKVSIDCSQGMKTKLHDRVSGGISNIRLDVTKLEIVYTLTSKARLVLWNGGEPNWEPIYSENPLCTRTVKLVDAGNTVVAYADNSTGITTEIEQSVWNGSGVYYIPIGLAGFPQTARVDLVYHVSTYNGSAWIPGASKEGSVTLYLNTYADAYKSGKHLYINISVNDETMTFMVTAAIADWTPGNGAGENVEAI